jgi:lipoprotein-releasing system ATP-binding protein
MRNANGYKKGNQIMTAQTPVLECRELSKTYADGKLKVEVFRQLDLSIAKGEQVAITGSSGEGKSTLLHLLGGLDQPTSGHVMVEGVDINSLNENKRCQLRNQKLGFIYQLHHLLPEFTVLENACMPLLLRNMPITYVKKRAIDLLEKVGLGARLEHKLGEISGGERQRTAFVRALVTQPICVLADEPTGNLDHETAHRVYETMLALNREMGTSFIVVTHDLVLAQRMDRVLILQNGQLMPREL